MGSRVDREQAMKVLEQAQQTKEYQEAQKIHRSGRETMSESMVIKDIFEMKDCIGQKFISASINIDKEKIDLFLKSTGDTNPVHFDEENAKKSLFSKEANNKVVVPGFLTLSLAANENSFYKIFKIQDKYEPITLGLDSIKFLHPVSINSNIFYEYEIAQVREREIKGRKSVITTYNVTAFTQEKDDIRKNYMKCKWTLGYISLD